MASGILLSLVNCYGKGESRSLIACDSKNLDFNYANRLKLIEHESGWYEARIVNPWDTTKLLQTLALVPKWKNLTTAHFPGNYTVVNVPIEKALIQTTVHVGLIEELGSEDAIVGVSDAEYIKSAKVQKKLKEGTIINCGGWMTPDLEKIVKLNPEAIFVSPYQNGGNYGHITELNIPIVYTADYMENSPLGRAEWIKYYGLLFGKKIEADSIFKEVETNYLHIKESVDSTAEDYANNKVLLDLPYMGSWHVHGAGSNNDSFIVDAGGVNPFSYIRNEATIAMPPEKVFFEASEADIWIIRRNSKDPLTLELIKSDYPMADRFKAFKEGRVWGCNTKDVFYYEETPFHPERLLADLYDIIHETNESDTLRYFIKLK